MTTSNASWNSHIWSCRRLKLQGVALIHYACRDCGRNFVDNGVLNVRYAVHVGVTRFNRLSDQSTDRWLSAACPGERLKSDQAELATRHPSETQAHPIKRRVTHVRTGLAQAALRTSGILPLTMVLLAAWGATGA
jgi:hypothetical protein